MKLQKLQFAADGFQGTIRINQSIWGQYWTSKSMRRTHSMGLDAKTKVRVHELASRTNWYSSRINSSLVLHIQYILKSTLSYINGSGQCQGCTPGQFTVKRLKRVAIILITNHHERAIEVHCTAMRHELSNEFFHCILEYST